MQWDGNVVDMTTIAVGIFSSLISPCRRYFTGKKPSFIREKAIADMMNGVVLVTFLMMIGAVFSSEVMKELLSSAKLTVAIGGMAGLFFIVGELFKGE